MRLILSIAALLAVSGCATTYQLSLMPRDSGKLYSGFVHDTGAGEGAISVTIEGTTYNGSWVQASPDRSYGYVSGAYGGRRGWGWGAGGIISMDNPHGAEAKALLTAANGAGLRCDFRSSYGTGGGVCRDDRGREYDVQMRAAPKS